MASIKISDLRAAGFNLSGDSKGFLDELEELSESDGLEELSESDLATINGGYIDIILFSIWTNGYLYGKYS